MSAISIDQRIFQVVIGTPPVTIDDVINKMEAMDNVLPIDDGLKWFNVLYLIVTKQIRDNPPASGWKHVEWVTRLDVIFASLYFDALANFLGNRPGVPGSWQALFEVRHKTGIDRIQFALAGMNAHINHDLALALVQTDKEFHIAPNKGSLEHDDFEHVNVLLEAALPVALQTLATGVLGGIAQDSGRIGRFLAIWDVRVARDLAWDFAGHLRSLIAPARGLALIAQDKLTSVIGRSLLLPL